MALLVEKEIRIVSRPDPRVIKEYRRPDSTHIAQICEVDNGRGLYVVVYQGRPFQYRTKLNYEINYPSWKYMRVSFANYAHADNLKTKLNLWFDTEDFQVVEMSSGEPVRTLLIK